MGYKLMYGITEIIELYNVNEILVYDCIDREWVIPADADKRLLDIEDVARILLIRDLKEDFGVNNESVPIILHLIDQLHWSRANIRHYLEHFE